MRAPEDDSPMVAPPASLTDCAGIHPVPSTLPTGAAHHLGVLKQSNILSFLIAVHTSSGQVSGLTQQYLERSQNLPELACLVELFYRVSILQTNLLKSLTIQA